MGKDQIFGQKQEQKTLEVTQHLNEAPQELVEAPQHMEEAPQQQFAQPVELHGAAPAPEMAQPVQQQQLGRKERWRQKREEKKQRKAEEEQRKAEEKQRKAEEKQRQKQLQEQAKRMAAAKVQVDKLVQQMRSNPIPGEDSTNYEAMRPTELFTEKGEYLERVVLTQIQDERLARELLNEVRVFTHHAMVFDKAAHDFRFRVQNVPAYIEDVLHQEVSPEITRLLNKEMEEFSDAAYGTHIITSYSAVEEKVFRHLSEQQQGQATTRSMRKGEEAQAYSQAIEQRMRQDNISRTEAMRRYAEDVLLQRRPVTLRKLEDQRRAHKESRDMNNSLKAPEEAAYHSLQYANEDIQRAHPGAPTLDWDAASSLTADYIRDATKNISYQMRVPNCRIMGLILDSGRFKTQMETNSSGAALDQETRKQFAKDSFGVDPETLPPDQFEIYGYASHGDLVKESKAESIVGQGVGQYGQVVVTLKKDAMRGRTTMMIGDSLDARMNARVNWVDRPDLQAVSAKARYSLINGAYEHSLRKAADPSHEVDLEDLLTDAQLGYAELQYHGGVRVEDIESVTLIADYIAEEGVEVEQEMPQELAERLKTLGIKAKIVKEGKEHEL